ncbi:hypothetical protein NQZ68_028749 [Dissostichus eleginoides]|nr:hypothetical protein NQZ68_028749 [Dissostichus eleginoides]
MPISSPALQARGSSYKRRSPARVSGPSRQARRPGCGRKKDKPGPTKLPRLALNAHHYGKQPPPGPLKMPALPAFTLNGPYILPCKASPHLLRLLRLTST